MPEFDLGLFGGPVAVSLVRVQGPRYRIYLEVFLANYSYPTSIHL